MHCPAESPPEVAHPEPGGPIVQNVGASAERWRDFPFQRYFDISALEIVRKGFFRSKTAGLFVVSVIVLVSRSNTSGFLSLLLLGISSLQAAIR